MGITVSGNGPILTSSGYGIEIDPFSSGNSNQLNTPLSLVATGEANSILLTWDDNNASGILNISIERSTSELSGFAEIATVAGGVESYNDSSGAIGVTYYYRIIAIGDTGYIDSGYSNTDDAFPFAIEFGALITYANANGIALNDSTYNTKLNQLSVDLSDAGVFTEADVVKVYWGDSGAFTLLNWKNPGTNSSTLQGSPTPTNDGKGWIGDGTNGYLNSGFDPTLGTKFLLDDNSVTFYNYTEGQVTSRMLGIQDNEDIFNVRVRNASNLMTVSNFSTTVDSTIANTTAIGLYTMKRISSTQVEVWKNGTLLSTITQNRSAFPTISTGVAALKNIFELGVNVGATLGAPTNKRIGMVIYGSKNINHVAVNTAWVNFLNTVPIVL
jgi:hypothetical protein